MKVVKLITLGMCCSFIAGIVIPAQANDIFTVSDTKSVTYADIGVGVLTRAPYVGSDQTDVSVLPFINAEYKGRFYLKPGQGAGVYLHNTDKFRVGTGANIALGRDAQDVPRLGVAGEIDTGLTGHVSARAYLPFAALDVIGIVPLGGDIDGARVDVALTTLLQPADNIRITPGIRATYMTGNWTDTYYGLALVQAAMAGTTPLSFDSGVSTLGVHAAAYWTLNEKVEIIAIANYSILVGDVKDSLLTPDNTSLTAGVGIARKF